MHWAQGAASAHHSGLMDRECHPFAAWSQVHDHVMDRRDDIDGERAAEPAGVLLALRLGSHRASFSRVTTCPGLVTLAMTACRSAAWAVIVSVGAAGMGVPSMCASR